MHDCPVELTCSPEEFMLWCDNGGGAQNVVGTTLKINATVLYFYSKTPYIILPVVICMIFLLYVISHI